MIFDNDMYWNQSKGRNKMKIKKNSFGNPVYNL